MPISKVNILLSVMVTFYYHLHRCIDLIFSHLATSATQWKCSVTWLEDRFWKMYFSWLWSYLCWMHLSLPLHYGTCSHMHSLYRPYHWSFPVDVGAYSDYTRCFNTESEAKDVIRWCWKWTIIDIVYREVFYNHVNDATMLSTLMLSEGYFPFTLFISETCMIWSVLHSHL